MSSNPHQGTSRGSNLGANPPRRSSYASVAAGSHPISQQPASVQLPPTSSSAVYSQIYSDQPWRIPQTNLAETDMAGEESARIPETWGSGSREQRRSSGSPSHLRVLENPWELLEGNSGANAFFKPTYLRGSKYLEDLEAVHNAKYEAQKEEASNSRSVHGSLSKSSSHVSLPKVPSSHRGIAYEIVEHQPPSIETGPVPLPSRWVQTDKHQCLEVGSDGQQVRYVGHSKLQEHEAAAARTDHPMPSQAGIYYYEVSILSKGKDGMIGVGFSGAKASLEKLPGWDPESWAYHGDDGKTFCCQSTGKSFGPTFSSGDTIGCGVNFTDGTGFFTKNGNFLGSAFRDIKDTALYPSVGMKRPHANLSSNFGHKPFVFDIDTYVERKRQEILNEIERTDTSALHATLIGERLTKAFIAQYLSHDGYVETAQAFAEEVRRDTSALTGNPESPVDDFLAVEDDGDLANRQQIRTAILDGDIDTALELTQKHFPKVLPSNTEINFRVRCRKYIEMMRESANMVDEPRMSKVSQFANGHAAHDGDQAMDLDDPPSHDGDASRNAERMDTSEAAAGRPSTYDEQIGETIAYGRILHQQFANEPDPKLRDYFKDTMRDLFGMIAYKDLSECPVASWLEVGERAKLAESLNSAILVSLGKSSSTALERLYKQTIVLTDIISEDGGPGALLNVRSILQPDHRPRSSSLIL